VIPRSVVVSASDPQNQPPSDRSSSWAGFVPQMLANAVGTLLAAVVIYIYGVAVGLIAGNWRVLLPIPCMVLLAGVAWILQHIEWDELPKGKRLRLLAIYSGPSLVLAAVSGYFAGSSNWPRMPYMVASLSPFVIVLGIWTGRWLGWFPGPPSYRRREDGRRRRPPAGPGLRM
jgi:hypothetical protein